MKKAISVQLQKTCNHVKASFGCKKTAKIADTCNPNQCLDEIVKKCVFFALIKKKIKLSSYIGKFIMEQLQSHEEGLPNI
jgi:hypothetical protein